MSEVNRIKNLPSKSDEGIPKNYIGITALFTKKEYIPPHHEPADWQIGAERVAQMRSEALKQVNKRYELCNAIDFADFWNSNLDAINEIGINPFARLDRFKELAGVMICFQHVEENPYTHKKFRRISWGIQRTLYVKFYKDWQDVDDEGNRKVISKLHDNRTRFATNIFKVKRRDIIFETENGESRTVSIPKNEVYNQFKFWCRANHMSILEGLYQSMDELMAHKPIKNLKNLGAWERKLDLDYSEIIIPDSDMKETVGVHCNMPKPIYDLMKKIVRCWNQDPENAAKPRLNLEKYLIQAADLMNKNSPLRYVDKKAYDEYVKMQEAQAYNESLMNK